MRIETRPIYICEGCGTEYVHEKDAADCEARGMPVQEFQEGDVVALAYAHYGWYDGDEAWIAWSEKGVSATGFLYSFFYVIGKVDHKDAVGRDDPHSLRYHLFTKAMQDRDGYNTATGHWKLVRAENIPAKVAAEAPKFRGRTTSDLIG